MRINEYESIDDFIFEYEKGKEFSWQNAEKRECFMGIEFKYCGKYYRMCREPFSDEERPLSKNGKHCFYDVLLIDCNGLYPQNNGYELIGWFEDLYDVLANCFIEGRPFKDVIMDDSIKILSKD